MNINTKYNVGERVYILDDNKKIKPAVIKNMSVTEDGILYSLEVKEFHAPSYMINRYEEFVYCVDDDERDTRTTEHGD